SAGTRWCRAARFDRAPTGSSSETTARSSSTPRSPRAMPTVQPIDEIDGVFIVTPDIHGDSRGFFVETYRRNWFPGGREMVQGNRGDRRQGAVVGLHYHLHQAAYWYVPFGRARVVLHDLREGGVTDGATFTVDLGADPDGGPFDHRGVYI